MVEEEDADLHLDIGSLDRPAGCPGRKQVCEGDQGSNHRHDCREEPEGVLYSHQRGVHGGRVWMWEV